MKLNRFLHLQMHCWGGPGGSRGERDSEGPGGGSSGSSGSSGGGGSKGGGFGKGELAPGETVGDTTGFGRGKGELAPGESVGDTTGDRSLGELAPGESVDGATQDKLGVQQAPGESYADALGRASSLTAEQRGLLAAIEAKEGIVDNFSLQNQEDIDARNAFAVERDTFLGRLASFVGLLDAPTESALRGAQMVDPSSFAAGQTAALGLDVTRAVTALTGAVPARVAAGIVEGSIAAFSDIDTAIGLASFDNRAAALAGPAGTLTGVATGMPSLGRAVSVGVGLAGTVDTAIGLGLTSAASASSTGFSDKVGEAVSLDNARTQPEQRTVSRQSRSEEATVTRGTAEFTRAANLPTRVRGTRRSGLTIGRVS